MKRLPELRAGRVRERKERTERWLSRFRPRSLGSSSLPTCSASGSTALMSSLRDELAKAKAAAVKGHTLADDLLAAHDPGQMWAVTTTTTVALRWPSWWRASRSPRRPLRGGTA